MTERAADADEFAAFVRANCRQLLRAAWLLTGDWATLECSVGTVKSSASRALAALRLDEQLSAALTERRR